MTSAHFAITRCKQAFKKGFTLIELLVVIGILAVLLAIVLIAINPARQFAQANDTQRRSDVNSILNAIHQYAAENGGNLPTAINTPPIVNMPISSAVGGTGAVFCTELVPTFVAALPHDPASQYTFVDCATAFNTGYTVSVVTSGTGGTGRVTVTATGQITPAVPIAVTR